MNKFQKKINLLIGDVYLVASEKGLNGVFWHKQPNILNTNTVSNSNISNILLDTEVQLNEYFAGKRIEFNLPFDIDGTDFQKNVWFQLSKIPFGKTCSYKEIARKINNEKSYRAVGLANAKNPLSIIVPCHRVISADGSLGGYAGGLEIKLKLLNFESNSYLKK